MLANVFLKTLRDQRRGLLGWGIGVVFLVAAIGAIWPSIRGMPNLGEFVANYPEALKRLFSLDAITTGSGFMNAELFTLMLPVLFIVFGIGRGARLIAGEEEDGTLDVILVTPVSTSRLLLQKAAALAVSIIALGVLLFVATALSSLAYSMDIGAAAAATGSLAMVLLGIEYGWLALAVGAITGRRVNAIAVPATVAFAAYVLYVAGLFVHAIEPWQPLSPFHQALNGGPLGAGLPAAYAWMAVAAVFFVGVALPIFDRRDIASL
jgi:ABC-2 type transport system permease protein